MTKTKKELITAVKDAKTKSAFMAGAKAYALDLLKDSEINEFSLSSLEKDLLNGAEDWKAYSYGACALVYDRDIALRVCTDSELKKTDFGNKEPNASENWLDVQARALRLAVSMIKKAF